MLNCIFCKIVAGKISSHTVYEDEKFLAFLDAFPHALGHTVVVPKIHHNNFLELSEVDTEKLMLAVKKTIEKIKIALNPDGFNVGWNEGSAGGQVVPHLHVHIFPRYEGDGGTSIHSIIKNPGAISVVEVAEKFKK
jgi:histidine triad (HIT) family protein